MFRLGGYADQGIMSGVVPRRRYQTGKQGMSNAAQGLVDWGLNLASATPKGSIFSTAAEAAKGPFANYQKRVAAQSERDFIREKFEEEKKQFRQKLEQDKYLGELEAQGEKQFIDEQINNYWDPIIAAEKDPTKKKALEDEKAADKYNVIVLGADISDKYKILSNAQATEIAYGNAETELQSTTNPATGMDWVDTDPGYSQKLQVLINKYLRLATKFLEEEKKAEGGRIGYQNAGPVMPASSIGQEETNQINISYEQLRERLPQEISDEIVQLLSQSYEAFADFAEIQTQADVNEFNTKYNVQLFLPKQSGA